MYSQGVTKVASQGWIFAVSLAGLTIPLSENLHWRGHFLKLDQS
jgi:hypothetical protein